MSQGNFERRWRILIIAAGIVLASQAGSPGAQNGGNGKYEKALKPAEAMVARWDFAGAQAALAKLKFRDKALADRLAVRRDEVARLVKLKGAIIARAKSQKPWIKRSMAVVSGKIVTTGVRVTEADDKGLTVTDTTAGGKSTRRQTWDKLDSKAVARLLKSTVSSRSADDQLAAGILALVRGEAAAAEKHFDKARSLGADTQRYLGPLATAALARVTELAKKGLIERADTALKALEKKYANTPWLDSHKGQLKVARGLISEAGAEALYAQAVKYFKQGKAKYPDLKEILQKLAKEYPSSRLLIDENRKPSFAEMELAAEGRKLITVSQTGKADFKTIQAAVMGAPKKGLIEIRDSATYEEEIIIPKEKKELMLRGKPGLWPVIKGPGISVRAPGVNIRDVVVTGALVFGADSFCLRKVIVGAGKDDSLIPTKHDKAKGCEVDTCFLAGRVGRGHHEMVDVSIRNSFIQRTVMATRSDFHNVLLSGKMHLRSTAKLQSCTLTGGIRCEGKELTILDSIVSYVEAVQGGARIEHCDVFGKGYLLLAKAGKGCFSKDPQFRNPKEFDYRLKLDSPCRKKASDGGDVGLRHTPEMLELLKKALELRKKGVIKF